MKSDPIIRIYIDTHERIHITRIHTNIPHINVLSLHFALTIWPGKLDIMCEYKGAI